MILFEDVWLSTRKQKAAIKLEIVPGHSLRREPFLKAPPHRSMRQFLQALDRLNGFRQAADGKAGQCLVDDLGHEPRLQAITGVPHAMASIITRPKGSGHLIGMSKRKRAAQETGLLRITNFSDDIRHF